MKSKNTIEDELNAIRVKLYEQTKDMLPEERVAFIRKQVDPTIKEFGLRTQEQL